MITKQTFDRHFRFVAGGVANTAVTYVIFLSTKLVMPYQLAYLVSYGLGIVLSYIYNAKAVFRIRLTPFGLMLWPLVYAVQYAAGALLLVLLVEKAKLPENLGPLFIAMVMVPVTYSLSRIVLKATNPDRGRCDG